jgi:hypothetical protein
MPLIAVALLGAAVEAGAQQQVADPKFDAKVARPAYPDKHPRVLIDEAHNNLHTSTGRYKPFVDLVTNDGYQVTANKEKFEKKTLDGYQILVIANAAAEGRDTAKSAFTKEECDAVHDWVQAGGSLLLIADHAPYGGWAESLADRFGVDMSKGHTRDKANSETGGPGWLIFSRDNKLLGDHPVTKGRDDAERLKRLTTFTGQSLKGPDGSVAFLALSESAVDALPPDRMKEVSAAGRAQGVAFKCGKGRVVVLGEAAVLSAQVIMEAGKEPHTPHGMNFPGSDNRQLALNIMHWLSGLLG